MQATKVLFQTKKVIVALQIAFIIKNVAPVCWGVASLISYEAASWY